MLSAGKQTRTELEYGDWGAHTPGKQTLTEQFYSQDVQNLQVMNDLQRVSSRAGETFKDGGNFVYRARADGAFEVIETPASYKAHFNNKAIPPITLSGATAVWHTLFNLLSQKPASRPAQPTAAADPRPSTPPVPSDLAGLASRESALRSETRRTVEGTPLEIANTRAALGDAGTHYHWGAGNKNWDKATDDEVNAVTSGDKNATAFWCSGLVMWSLVAAGYDLEQPLHTFIVVSKDQMKFSRQLNGTDKRTKALAEKAGTKTVDGTEILPTDWAIEVRITPHSLIEGMADRVAVMTYVERQGLKDMYVGAWRNLPGNGNGFKAGMEDEPTQSVRGAAGAFVLAGIGTEVPSGQQKPGDFAQIRRREKNADHVGAGHAFQVWSVHAKGAAMFGQAGSPEPVTGTLEGWHTDVEFIITKETSPALVGMHTFVREKRLEANIRSTFADKTGDGGVQITKEEDHKEDGFDSQCFYGRLASSPWTGWVAATAPAQESP